MPNAILLLQLLPDGIDALGVLVGADGEGGGEPVEAVLGGILGRTAHPQPITDRAATAAFRLVLEARDSGVELLRVVPVFHHCYPSGWAAATKRSSSSPRRWYSSAGHVLGL